MFKALFSKKTYPELFDEFFDDLIIISVQSFLIGHIELGSRAAIWAQIFINMISLRLKDADATAMKPIRALFAANIEPEKIEFFNMRSLMKLENEVLLSFIVGLLANAVDFTVFTSISTFIANVFTHGFCHAFVDANARAMEPVAANITANVKPEKMEQ